MKKIYIVTILLILVTMCFIGVMTLLDKVDLRLVFYSIVFMNGITLIVLLVDKSRYKQMQMTEPANEIVTIQDSTDENTGTSASFKDKPEMDETIINWNSAMYQRFYERWTNTFDKVNYPIDKSEKAEISVMTWEIASLAMDYLMYTNNSPNLLERNKESVKSIVEGRNYQDMGLKQFYEDPTTIPAKVLAVYNTLCPQVAARQSFETNIFGYYVEIPNKK